MKECAHCGITESCCWRKGPAEKATLCNACGARWLARKSLEGYFPGTRKGGGSLPRRAAQEGAPVKRGPMKRKADGSHATNAARLQELYELQQLTLGAALAQAHVIHVSHGAEPSESSGHHTAREDDYGYVDASSDDQDHIHHESSPELPHRAAAAAATAGDDFCFTAFARRPRKQLRPTCAQA